MHYCDHALSAFRPSSLTFHIFDDSSETTVSNITKLDRKQDIIILYIACVLIFFFRADQKNKMAALADPSKRWHIVLNLLIILHLVHREIADFI